MSKYDDVITDSLALANDKIRAFSLAQMSSRVVISRRVEPIFNAVTGVLSDPDTTIYDGIAQVGDIQGAQQMVLGDQVEFYSTVTIRIPDAAAPTQIDDVVTIMSSIDPGSVVRAFRVAQIALGGDLYANGTELTCVGVTHSRTQRFT